MKEYEFAEQVKKKFYYLMDDYGFFVIEERYDPEAFGNSLVRFRSVTVEIAVVLDRGHVLIDVTPSPKVSDYPFDLLNIIEFLAPEAGEMTYIYPEEPAEYNEKIDWQINRLASLLQQYAVPVLRGEFSSWKELNERTRQEALREYKELTGKDPIIIDSKAAWDKIQTEKDRRVAEQRRPISPEGSSSDQKETESPIPWWAFWRRK